MVKPLDAASRNTRLNSYDRGRHQQARRSWASTRLRDTALVGGERQHLRRYAVVRRLPRSAGSGAGDDHVGEVAEAGLGVQLLQHSKDDPDVLLEEHTPKTVHLTIALAIMLWKEHGQEETEAMRTFSALPSPYKPGYRHSTALKLPVAA
jgi:hypothetical protein